jgi:hypothetical protein
MIPLLVTAVFFVAIIAALHFSMWAEGWLASSAVRVEKLMPAPTAPAASEFTHLDIEHEAAPAA